MFAPHHTENAQLSDVWVAPENLLNACVFFARYAVLRSDLGSDSDFVASGGHISILQRRAETPGHDISRPAKTKTASTRVGAPRIMRWPWPRRQASPPRSGR